MRDILPSENLTKEAQAAIDSFHADAVKGAQQAVAAHEWVVIGMAGNPLVKKARNHLAAKGKAFEYIEHGSYLKQWRKRLAIKLWSGWPTFPQVFHKGKLVGGYTDLEKYLP